MKKYLYDGIKSMPDGWHNYNPNNAKCDCGSLNVEFFWQDGEARSFHCKDCDYIQMDKG